MRKLIMLFGMLLFTVAAYGQPANTNVIVSVQLTNGDSTQATSDYSTTSEDTFYYAPSGEEIVFIHRMIVYIEDVGGLDAGKYGNDIDLDSGIVIQVIDSSSVLYSLTDSNMPIKSNAQWAGYCHDFTDYSFGTGNEIGTVRWTFDKSGIPIKLEAESGDQIIVILNDDFSGLVDHRFLIQGYKIEKDSYLRQAGMAPMK